MSSHGEERESVQLKATSAKGDAATLERIVRTVKEAYPKGTVKVRRGRVVVVEGDLIRWIKFSDLDRAAA
jgi:hypothetical protein